MAHTSHPPFVSVPVVLVRSDADGAARRSWPPSSSASAAAEASGSRPTWRRRSPALTPGSWFLDLVTQRFPDAFTPADAYAERRPDSARVVYMLLVGLTKDGHWLQFAQVAPRLFAGLDARLGVGLDVHRPGLEGHPAVRGRRAPRALFWTGCSRPSARRRSPSGRRSSRPIRTCTSRSTGRGRRCSITRSWSAPATSSRSLDPGAGPRPPARRHHRPRRLRAGRARPAPSSTSTLPFPAAVALAQPHRRPARTGDASTRCRSTGVTVIELAVLFAAPVRRHLADRPRRPGDQGRAPWRRPDPHDHAVPRVGGRQGDAGQGQHLRRHEHAGRRRDRPEARCPR